MKAWLRRFIKNDNAFLLFYHKLKAVLAAIVYGFPARKLKVIGVTGTNGKTSTVNIAAHLLESAGYKVGMLSSIRFKIGGKVLTNKSKMSTQSPFAMQKLLRKMARAKCDYAIIEVTSHSVVQSRIWGINFDVGVWTNLSEDHLTYHGSWENYRAAKGEFIKSIQGFKRKVGVPKTVILGADDPEFAYYDQYSADKKYTFGLQKGTLRAENVQLRSDGSSFSVQAPNAQLKIDLALIGDFNILNSLAAIAICLSQELTPEQIEMGFKSLEPISGRYEPVKAGQPFTVIVDYAHTVAALEKLCEIFNELTTGRTFLVFGSTGGGRDIGKRPKLGKVAVKHADVIIITDDDPYEEDRLAIIEQVAAGAHEQMALQEREVELYEIVDRAVAIETALEMAQPGDTVLIAGKGSEPVMAIDGKLIPWDDREVVRNVLAKTRVVDL